jgi:plastocyanin
MRSALLAAGLCLGLGAIAAANDLQVKVQNVAGAPASNAIVYATPKNPVAQATGNATIDQIDRQFVPRVTVLQTGTAVAFPNSDNIRHSVYSFSPPKIFTLKLYAGKPASPVVFDKPGIVVLGCNIHDNMLAWVLVVDTPYFARMLLPVTTRYARGANRWQPSRPEKRCISTPTRPPQLRYW